MVRSKFRIPQPADIIATSEHFEQWPGGDYTLPFATRSIYVNGVGNLVVDRASDDTQVTIPVTAGSTLVIAVSKVYGTTTATGINLQY